mmetsp:Transcript_88126/g.161351  ORF Transcript_88126/g.161351 Transcript_88126/m.161351 type:complete len:181 (-) Transcript_88126:831-1373(-)
MHSTNKQLRVTRTISPTKNVELLPVDGMIENNMTTISIEHTFLKMSTTDCNGNRWGMDVMKKQHETMNAKPALWSCHAGLPEKTIQDKLMLILTAKSKTINKLYWILYLIANDIVPRRNVIQVLFMGMTYTINALITTSTIGQKINNNMPANLIRCVCLVCNSMKGNLHIVVAPWDPMRG